MQGRPPIYLSVRPVLLSLGLIAVGLVSTNPAIASGRIQIQPRSHTQGHVQVGGPAVSFPLNVTNTGGANADSFKVSPPKIHGSEAFAVGHGNHCAGKTLSPGASCTIQVRFHPTSIGAKTATLTVSATPGGSAKATLKGTGTGLTTGPKSLDFGTVQSGTASNSKIFKVTNTGDVSTGALKVGKPGDAFELESDNCKGKTLKPHASCTLTVRFQPTSAGARSGTINVAAKPGGTVAVSLTGSGTPLSITPSAMDFGTVTSGLSSPPTAFTVTNTGTAPTGTLSLSLGGSIDFLFGSTNTCSGTLAAGDHCSVDVSFAPSSGGAKTASLTATAAPGGSAAASLSGSGG